MKERPILFTGEMVRAILEGRKTQTRRAMKPQPYLFDGRYFFRRGQRNYALPTNEKDEMYKILGLWDACPYGVPGHRLWVKETWSDCDPIRYRADLDKSPWRDNDQKWKSPIFMPRAYSRISLEIVSIGAERVQEIKADDCIAEGMERLRSFALYGAYGENYDKRYRAVYSSLWDSINGKKHGHAWCDNPWVWVVEFKRL